MYYDTPNTGYLKLQVCEQKLTLPDDTQYTVVCHPRWNDIHYKSQMCVFQKLDKMSDPVSALARYPHRGGIQNIFENSIDSLQPPDAPDSLNSDYVRGNRYMKKMQNYPELCGN